MVQDFACTGAGAKIGCKHTSGDWMGVLSAQDRLLDEWPRTLVETLNAQPDAEVLCSDHCEIDQNSIKNKLKQCKVPSRAHLLAGDAAPPELVIFHKNLIKSLGAFDETLETRVAFEFLVRATACNPKIAKLSQPVLGRRVLKESRRASASELEQMLAHTDEAIAVLQGKDLQPGDFWLLEKYAIEAQQAGLNRLTGLDFDKYVYSAALKARREFGNSSQGKASGIGLLWNHMRVEAYHLLKRPKYASRLVIRPTRTRKPTAKRPEPVAPPVVEDNRPSHRIFQLRFNEPEPCRLPASYFRKQRASSLSITIVTPNLNQGRFIERTIKSVVSQGYPHLEYVVQDGCSTDQSVEVIRRYESYFARWQSVKDRGQSHAINMGLERTTGDIMAYLNSDDILLPAAWLTWLTSLSVIRISMSFMAIACWSTNKTR